MNNAIGFDLDFPKEYLKAAVMVSLLSVWVLVGLFYYLNRYTKRRYFTIWTGAWLFYALWLTLTLGQQSQQEVPLFLMLKQWCLSAAAVLLLWGSARFLKLRSRQTMFGLFIVFLFVWSYVGAYHLDDPFQSQCPIFGLIGLASLQCSSCFFRFRRKRDYIGAGLLSFGFGLWGIYLITYPFLQRVEHLISAGFFISTVLQLFIAVSMIVLVLEEMQSKHEHDLETIRSMNSERAALHIKVISTEERFRCLFDQASEGIVITDASALKILELNRTGERLLGINRADSGDQTLSSFFQLTGPSQPAPQSCVDWFDLIQQQRQLRLVRRDGGVTLTEPFCSRIHFEGQPAYQFCFRELTERARLEQQLRQAEKLSALGRMISGVAHELNNPLAVIKGYLELVLSRHPLHERTRSDLEKVAHEGNRAAKLVSNFLSFAREQRAVREQVDLNELVRCVAELRKFELLTCGVELKLDLDPHLPPTLADQDQLQQVLVNVVTNALHALADAPHPRRLRIRSHRIGELSQVVVEDSGPGVPDHILAKIFEPFFTTKEVGTGTGLGLSIVHSIMTDHHGRVHYRQSALGGAAFVLEFPLVAMESEQRCLPDVVAKHDAAFAPKVSTKAAQILVLDDEEQLTEMLAEFMTMLGHTPTICTAAQRALDLIEDCDFDMILSDFRMPGLNGQQFYQIVAAKKPELARRIVFLTGDLVNDNTRQFLESTGNPHLGKPFTLASIQRIMERVLSARVVQGTVKASHKPQRESYEANFADRSLPRAYAN